VHCRVEGEMLLTPASLLSCSLLPVITKLLPPKPIDVEPSVQIRCVFVCLPFIIPPAALETLQ